jgi:hypothetical protein
MESSELLYSSFDGRVSADDRPAWSGDRVKAASTFGQKATDFVESAARG